MSPVQRLCLTLTANPRIPLALRRALAAKCIAYDGQPFSIEIAGREYSGLRDNYIEWLVYATRDYFEFAYLNMLRQIVSGGAVMDVGANVGNHSHAFAAFFDEVHAFEPYGAVADRLEQKVKAFANVQVHRIALGAATDVLSFAVPTSNNLGTGHIDNAGGISVSVEPADEYMQGKLSQPLKLVKIDVEGHELEVLQGMQGLLSSHMPLVMFEVPKVLLRDTSRSVAEAFALFPSQYRFLGLKGQTSFPVQRPTPKVFPIGREAPRVSDRLSYILAYTDAHQLAVLNSRVVPGVQASGVE